MRVTSEGLSRRALVLGPLLLLLPRDAEARRRWRAGGGNHSPFALIISGVLLFAILLANSVFGRDLAPKGTGKPRALREAEGRFTKSNPINRGATPRRRLSPWVFVLPIVGILMGGAYGWATMPPEDVIEASFPVCGVTARITCVVDGDTFWLDGVKYRIADIDTPEIGEPRCAEEKALGVQATLRLQSLLNAGAFGLKAGMRDEDKYGRKLREVYRGGRSLGAQLVDEGLAHRWIGFKQSWCG
ncbi:thermonuclease family protein [Ensifer sp. B1-9]|uniref:thermonuclease family protein n=1 Tax=Ensifer sp. B1-9 TaxID=3141455 RepID=UPI003D232A54